MHKNAIELKSVSKYYKLYESPRDRLKEALDPRDKSYHKKFFAVKNVDLCIPKGEIIGILGVNGSGKSTLLKLIAHVLTPSSGDIQVNGRISALLELGAGFNPNFTGLENVHFYGSIMGLSRGEVEEKLDGILSFADIGEFVNQPLKTYSSGMKARLGFAIATEVDSEILIIDEVLAVGDAAFKRKCFARIEYLLGEGKTVLIVSHNKNSIASLCTRGIVLHKGSLVVDGDVNKTIREYEVLINQDAYIKAKNEDSEIPCVSDNETPSGREAVKHKHDYDPALLPESKKLGHAKIKLNKLLMVDNVGFEVNILKTGQKYNLQFWFTFFDDFVDLTLAIRFKTIEGYVLAWNGFPRKRGETFNVKKNEEKNIELQFDCSLLDGVYAVDVAIQSVGQSDIVIHLGYRDALMFKINKTDDNQFGHCHMNLVGARED